LNVFMHTQFLWLLMALLGLSACDGMDELSKLKKIAEAGNAAAQHNLALHLSAGDESSRDYLQAVEWYKKAAAQGVADSAHNLGLIYKSGAPGLLKDHGEACQWFRQAAELELPAAMYQYSLCLGGTKDAVDWMRRAADAGVADAAANLGVQIMYGHGVPQDVRLGIEWEKRAAEMGSPMGMHNYAVSLAQGLGGEKNPRAAFEWFSKAVTADYCASYAALASYYRYGQVVAKDEKKALELIYAGAAKGDKVALRQLAKVFYNGELGQPKDAAKADSVRVATPTCGI